MLLCIYSSFTGNDGGHGGVVSTGHLPLTFNGFTVFSENRGASLAVSTSFCPACFIFSFECVPFRFSVLLCVSMTSFISSTTMLPQLMVGPSTLCLWGR